MTNTSFLVLRLSGSHANMRDLSEKPEYSRQKNDSFDRRSQLFSSICANNNLSTSTLINYAELLGKVVNI